LSRDSDIHGYFHLYSPAKMVLREDPSRLFYSIGPDTGSCDPTRSGRRDARCAGAASSIVVSSYVSFSGARSNVFPSEGYSTLFVTFSRARNGNRHQESCNRPVRLRQNLSFVIVPLRTVSNFSRPAWAGKTCNCSISGVSVP